MVLVIWILIFLCLIQSAIFSGLTIGLFGLTRLRLETEAEAGNKSASKILQIRKDSNYLLTTLLWGNVSVNVLIALLTDSVMTGTAAFMFSAIFITCFGEIAPQAYFTRKAMGIGAYLVPLVRFYQILFFPVAKPTALLLDHWLGKEQMFYFKENAFRIMLEKHIKSSQTDIGRLEGIGALNFLSIDDISISDEGSVIDPSSIITLPIENGRPIFPEITRDPSDSFLKRIDMSGKKWVIITDHLFQPVMVMDADGFLRDALYTDKPFYPFTYCHRPIVITSPDTKLDSVIPRLKVYPVHPEDDVIDMDLLLYWGPDEKRIITGSDILGRLLRGIVVRV